MIKKLLMLTVLLGGLASCGKITADNFEKIKAGMDYDVVVETLGKPDKCTEIIGTKRCTWGDEAKNIQITFIAGKATLSTQAGLK